MTSKVEYVRQLNRKYPYINAELLFLDGPLLISRGGLLFNISKIPKNIYLPLWFNKQDVKFI